ncbi:hypothetical protein [Sphingomonas sp. MMS24-J13]|uniref:hypothetical protein n=1 Tax=Sphingomonas sp. MMS24-J13 TaxID=3238686 RepID=UPI00384F1F7D
MTRTSTLIAGLGLVLAAAPVGAQAIDADIKCMLASDVFARNEKDPGRKQLAVVSGLFFFGRIDGRLAAPQIKAQLLAAQRGIKPTDLPPIMNDCVKRFQSRELALQAIGKSIAPPAAATPAPGKPAPAPASR